MACSTAKHPFRHIIAAKAPCKNLNLVFKRSACTRRAKIDIIVAIRCEPDCAYSPAPIVCRVPRPSVITRLRGKKHPTHPTVSSAAQIPGRWWGQAKRPGHLKNNYLNHYIINIYIPSHGGIKGPGHLKEIIHKTFYNKYLYTLRYHTLYTSLCISSYERARRPRSRGTPKSQATVAKPVPPRHTA